jgi:Mn-dependent DtxR family transcriptional regulator
MVATIAKRMGVSFGEASAIADDCARREWVEHVVHLVRLLEEARRVASRVRKTIIGKGKP